MLAVIGRAIPAGGTPAAPLLGSILRGVSEIPLRTLDEADRDEIRVEILASRRRRERDERARRLEVERAARKAAGLPKGGGDRRRLFDLLDSYRTHATGKPRQRKGVTYPPRLTCCGHQRHGASTSLLQLGQGDELRTQWRGVIRCRSKGCPYCLAIRKSGDGEIIKRVAAAHHDCFGLSATLLATLTIRHQLEDSLADTWKGVRKAWRLFLSGRAWAGAPAYFTKKRRQYRPAVEGARDRWSLADFVVGEECTHGCANGWHSHLHAFFLPRRELTVGELRDAGDWIAERWAACVLRAMGPRYVPSRERGTDLRRCTRAEYVAKLGIDLSAVRTPAEVGALEVADPGHKRGRRDGHRTPLELLAAWCDTRDERALVLYQTFERHTRGTPDVTWSKSLRRFRDLARREQREAFLLERAAAVTVASIPGSVHDALVARGGQTLCDVQEAGEVGGLGGVVALVEALVGAQAAQAVRELSAQHDEHREKCVGLFDAANTREWFAG